MRAHLTKMKKDEISTIRRADTDRFSTGNLYEEAGRGSPEAAGRGARGSQGVRWTELRR